MKKRRGFFKFFLENTAIVMIDFLNKKLVKRINHDELRTFTAQRLLEQKLIAKTLTDADPNDKEQLEQLWNEKIKPSLQSGSLGTARSFIEEFVKDKDIRATLLSLLHSYEAEYGNYAA